MKIPKNWLKIIMFCLGSFNICTLHADNMIVAYLKHAPEDIRREVEEEYQKNKDLNQLTDFAEKTPSQIHQRILKGEIRKYLTPSLSGFVFLYGGYMDISTPDGLVTFPLRHSSPKLYLAITPDIKLVKVQGNTFSHAEFISDQNPIKLYQFEKKEDEKQQAYWAVSEVAVPTNKRIDPITIVILSKPKNFFISEGHFLTTKSAQFVMPDLYVIGNDDKENVLLKILDIKQYFEPINIEEKKTSDTSFQKLIKNL